MKTRILKTQIHTDEVMFTFTPDVRAICKYLYSNSHIDLIPIYKIPVQLIQLETGYDISTIKLALDIMEKSNVISHFNYLWVKLLREDFAALEYTGEKNEKAKEKYIKSIPSDVWEYFINSNIDTTIDTTTDTTDKSKIINQKSKIINKNTEEDFSFFDKFWSEYPARRVDKQKCKEKFLKLDIETQKIVVQDVKDRKEKDYKWIKNNHQFVPMTSTYLNNKKWEDDYEINNDVVRSA